LLAETAPTVRLNAYVSFNKERAEHDEDHQKGITSFHSAFATMVLK
jgi:hypothetical protein